MPVQRLRRWPIIKPTLDQCFMSVECCYDSQCMVVVAGDVGPVVLLLVVLCNVVYV